MFKLGIYRSHYISKVFREDEREEKRFDAQRTKALKEEKQLEKNP